MKRNRKPFYGSWNCAYAYAIANILHVCFVFFHFLLLNYFEKLSLSKRPQKFLNIRAGFSRDYDNDLKDGFPTNGLARNLLLYNVFCIMSLLDVCKVFFLFANRILQHASRKSSIQAELSAYSFKSHPFQTFEAKDDVCFWILSI